MGDRSLSFAVDDFTPIALAEQESSEAVPTTNLNDLTQSHSFVSKIKLSNKKVKIVVKPPAYKA